VNERRRPRAVLDTDIIFSRVLHELIGRIAAELRLLDLFWSEQLLGEAQRSLVEKKQLPSGAARRWVDYLRLSFPAGRIDVDPNAIEVADLTRDPGDAHVCALVVAAHADYLFTHDRGYLRDGLSHHEVQVLAPDEFLADVLDADTRGVLGVLGVQASTWAGGRSVEELLDALERAGAPTFARKVRELI
jgi:predicted nucleic acid-binding protein